MVSAERNRTADALRRDVEKLDAEAGVEPAQRVSETRVLPLDDSAIVLGGDSNAASFLPGVPYPWTTRNAKVIARLRPGTPTAERCMRSKTAKVCQVGIEPT